MCAVHKKLEQKMSEKNYNLREEVEKSQYLPQRQTADRNSVLGLDHDECGMAFADVFVGKQNNVEGGGQTGKRWHVPEIFELPSNIPLRTAMRLWLEGMPSYRVEEANTHLLEAALFCPFCFLQVKVMVMPKKN